MDVPGGRLDLGKVHKVKDPVLKTKQFSKKQIKRMNNWEVALSVQQSHQSPNNSLASRVSLENSFLPSSVPPSAFNDDSQAGSMTAVLEQRIHEQEMQEKKMRVIAKQAGGRLSLLLQNLQQLPGFKGSTFINSSTPATEHKQAFDVREDILWKAVDQQLGRDKSKKSKTRLSPIEEAREDSQQIAAGMQVISEEGQHRRNVSMPIDRKAVHARANKI